MKHGLAIGILLLMLGTIVLRAQDSIPFTEKVYLHTDQDTYLTGEYIWLSAYLTDGQQAFSHLSKVLYVEVLEPDNKPVLQTKLALEEGRGHGSLFIPASLASGMYTLRAYTNWMRNRPPDYFFHKSLRILNPFIPLSGEEKLQDEPRVSVVFYPEGGTWVSGIPGRMGFHVADEHGRGIPFRGLVTDQTGDTIALFSPTRFGRGSIDMTPGNGNYLAVIKDVFDSVITQVNLPQAAPRGMTLMAERSRTGYTIQVACAQCPPDTPVRLEVAGASGETTVNKLTLTEGSGRLDIPFGQLTEGVSWVRLTTQYGQVLASRALFRYPDIREVSLSITPETLSPRQEVSYRINAPEGARLSVSVFRKDELYRPGVESLLSSVYLTQALGVALEDANYFFRPGSGQELEDLLRMQRLNTENSAWEYLPEQRGQLITTQLKNAGGRKPANIPVYLSLPGKPFVFRVGLTDSTGTVRFQAGDVHGQRTLIITPAIAADSMLVFEPKPMFAHTYAPGINEQLTLNPESKQAVEARSLGMQMDNIYHGDDRARLLTSERDTLPFYGFPTHQYRLDEYTRFPSMLDVIKEYVYTVAARRRDKSYVFRVLDAANNSHFSTPPLTLLDGVPVVNHDRLIRYDPLKVEKIDVIAGKYVFGPMAFPGIVSFSTYERNLEDFDLSSSVVQVDYQGIQYTRKFYIPDHSLPANQRKPDMRALLLWDPDVHVGNSGSHTGVFHTSDRPGTYLMIVEGITGDGRPVYEEQQFEVTPDLHSQN